MESILLTFTLKSESEKDSILMEHLKKFRSGKGKQERSFEIRRLLLAGLSNQRALLESFEVKDQSLYQNTSVGTMTTHGVYSSNSIEDVYQDSSNQFTVEAVSGIPEISLSQQVGKVRESVNVIAVIEVDTKINVEQQTQQSLPASSPFYESVNAENSDPNSSAEMLASVAAWDFGMAKQAENTNVTTGEIT